MSKLALLALLALSTFLSLSLSCKRVAPEVILVLVLKFAEEPLLLLGVFLDTAEAGESGRGEGLLLLPTFDLSSIRIKFYYDGGKAWVGFWTKVQVVA